MSRLKASSKIRRSANGTGQLFIAPANITRSHCTSRRPKPARGNMQLKLRCEAMPSGGFGPCRVNRAARHRNQLDSHGGDRRAVLDGVRPDTEHGAHEALGRRRYGRRGGAHHQAASRSEPAASTSFRCSRVLSGCHLSGGLGPCAGGGDVRAVCGWLRAWALSS